MKIFLKNKIKIMLSKNNKHITGRKLTWFHMKKEDQFFDNSFFTVYFISFFR